MKGCLRQRLRTIGVFGGESDYVVEYCSALQDSLLISWCGFVHIATINQNHHLPRIYYLKARNQKCFATHTPLRCRPALEPVDMFAPPAPPLPCDGGGLLVLVPDLTFLLSRGAVGHGGLLLL